MNKKIIVVVAKVKSKSSNNDSDVFINANSYVVRTNEVIDIENSVNDFRLKVEAEGFIITSLLIYIIPNSQIEEINELSTNDK